MSEGVQENWAFPVGVRCAPADCLNGYLGGAGEPFNAFRTWVSSSSSPNSSTSGWMTFSVCALIFLLIKSIFSCVRSMRQPWSFQAIWPKNPCHLWGSVSVRVSKSVVAFCLSVSRRFRVNFSFSSRCRDSDMARFSASVLRVLYLGFWASSKINGDGLFFYLMNAYG